MSEEFDHLNGDEKLKAENDFLKMKLMLEHGAVFGEPGNEAIPDEIENAFLNNMMAFEEQFKSRKTTTVYDKVGQPGHFKPVAEIADEDIEAAYKALLHTLHQHGVNIDAYSPNVTTRELYRFVTEELFSHETDDISVPGWTTNFIYDEFYPDPIYDNTRTAVDYCIRQILNKDPMDWTHHLSDEGADLNQHLNCSREKFKSLITLFQQAYDALIVSEIDDAVCTITDGVCTVTGTYDLTATVGRDEINLCGNWNVKLKQESKWNYWQIIAVNIANINL